MNFKKWVKSIQTAGYNGARTVISLKLFRSFRGHLFRKPLTGQDFFCCFLQQTGSNANKITLFLQNLEISRNYCENLKEDSNIVCTSVLWVPISGPRSYRPGLHHLLIILLIRNSLYVRNK